MGLTRAYLHWQKCSGIRRSYLGRAQLSAPLDCTQLKGEDTCLAARKLLKLLIKNAIIHKK